METALLTMVTVHMPMVTVHVTMVAGHDARLTRHPTVADNQITIRDGRPCPSLVRGAVGRLHRALTGQTSEGGSA